MTKAVLFDLDGTLVDSAQGVIGAFRWVLETHHIEPKVALDHALIGPPLRETLGRITGIREGEHLETLATAFRKRYDAVVADVTPAYPGLHHVLSRLREAGFDLYIATNKRIKPTRLIVKALGVAGDFAGVYAPDALDPAAPDKPSLVATMVRVHEIIPAASVFVGDSTTDAGAAAANGIPFIGARYGYGDPAGHGDPVAASIETLADLPAAIAGLFP